MSNLYTYYLLVNKNIKATKPVKSMVTIGFIIITVITYLRQEKNKEHQLNKSVQKNEVILWEEIQKMMN